jgi:parvulin-like peptidyl-prolyl isomerase
VWVLQPREFSSSQARVKHILVTFKQGDPVDRARALELINDLQRRLKNGDSFGKLAKQYSNDSFSSARGGDLGYQARGIYSKNFENYVWSAPIGQLSDIIETEHGFHIVEVTDRFVAKADEYEINLEKKYAPKGAAAPATDEAKPEVKPAEGQ